MHLGNGEGGDQTVANSSNVVVATGSTDYHGVFPENPLVRGVDGKAMEARLVMGSAPRGVRLPA